MRSSVFTGIVQALCPVTAITDRANLRRLSIDLGETGAGLVPGASVAVNGVCLTATTVVRGAASFDVIEETLRITNLADLVPGTPVNVERSMRVGDEIGGHQLSGHVVGTVSVQRIDSDVDKRVLWLDVAERWLPYLLYKGFVALDGASLTISAIEPDNHSFAVSLIPETIARTTLGRVQPGDRVNLELDAQTQTIVSTVMRVLADPALRLRLDGGEGKESAAQGLGGC
jgi:riboflavin synthase